MPTCPNALYLLITIGLKPSNVHLMFRLQLLNLFLHFMISLLQLSL